MGVESAADRAAFFNTDEFATAATYSLAAGGDSTINGIFDDGHSRIEGLGEMAVTSSEPTFTLAASDLPTGAEQGEGDTLTVNSVVYNVVEIQPEDDEAVTTLILDRQA